jgi:hypothetical protein
VYKIISFHSEFALDGEGHYSNDKTFVLPTEDPYLLAVLNSAAAWWQAFHTFPRMKDDAIAMAGFKVEDFPIPRPTAAQRGPIVSHAERLVALARRRQEAVAAFLAHVAEAAALERLTRKLETYWDLDDKLFQDEVRKAGGKAVSPGLARAFRASRGEVRHVVEEECQLEIKCHHRVFELYGLAESEVRLLRERPVPRDPLALAQARRIG